MDEYKAGDKIYFTGIAEDKQKQPGWFNIKKVNKINNFIGSYTTYDLSEINGEREIRGIRFIYGEYIPGMHFITEKAYEAAYDEHFKNKIQEGKHMDLKDIKTLREISKETGLPESTIKARLKSKARGMQEGIHYRRLGPRMPIIFSPEGVERLTGQKGHENL